MMQKLLYEQNEYLPAFLQLFHFPQFDFNLWVIQLCGVVSQLALSDPPAWVQTSHLCPLTRQAPRCTTCPLSWPAASPPPPLQLPMLLLSYTWLSRNFPWVIISFLTLIFSPGVGFAYWCFRRSWTWNLISWLCFGFHQPLETVTDELPLMTLAAKGTVQIPQCTATPPFQTRWMIIQEEWWGSPLILPVHPSEVLSLVTVALSIWIFKLHSKNIFGLVSQKGFRLS